jgi:hypothetical protein|nr:MAG: hypothetical protein DIU52_12300 [bacterium]
MSGRQRAILGYAVASGLAVGLGVLVAAVWLGPQDAAAVRTAAVAAYVIQVVGFAALVSARGARFFVAWGGGTLLRLGAVLAAAVWLARTQARPPAPLMLGLAGFLFVLLLLEPIFFRMGLRSE